MMSFSERHSVFGPKTGQNWQKSCKYFVTACSLNDCKGIRTHNYLVRERTLNHLAKLAKITCSQYFFLKKYSIQAIQVTYFELVRPWSVLQFKHRPVLQEESNLSSYHPLWVICSSKLIFMWNAGHKILNLNVAQKHNNSCHKSTFMHQWVFSCQWQRCRDELNKKFSFGNDQNKIYPDLKINDGREA